MRRAGLTMLWLLLGALPAAAQELPPRKPGLWELTHTYETPNLPVQTAQHCIDAATDWRMRLIWFHPDQTACAGPQIRRSDGAFTVERACALGSQRTRQHAVIAGDFSAAYTVELTSTEFILAQTFVLTETPQGLVSRQGPFTRDTRTRIAAKWIGECKIWMDPGDMFFGYGKRSLREWPHLAAPNR